MKKIDPDTFETSYVMFNGNRYHNIRNAVEEAEKVLSEETENFLITIYDKRDYYMEYTIERNRYSQDYEYVAYSVTGDDSNAYYDTEFNTEDEAIEYAKVIVEDTEKLLVYADLQTRYERFGTVGEPTIVYGDKYKDNDEEE